ncbi:hypothetical protein ACTXT7_012772 [Hymenolepis weldensis]
MVIKLKYQQHEPLSESNSNAYLEKAMHDVTAEAEELRRRIEVELTDSARERGAAEEALAKAHDEMAALMDVKLNLEAEISAYRRLLDAQGGILSGDSGTCGGYSASRRETVSSPIGRTRSSRDVMSRPRPSSVSPQRRATAPVPVSDMLIKEPRKSKGPAERNSEKMRRYSTRSITAVPDETPVQKIFIKMKKSIGEMIDGYVREDPAEVSTIMCTKLAPTMMVFGVVVVSTEGHIMTPQFFPQSLRVSANADAHVETLQTIVKPPWIDSVANGRL